MLELLWMWLTSVYHKVRPQENPEDGSSEKPTSDENTLGCTSAGNSSNHENNFSFYENFRVKCLSNHDVLFIKERLLLEKRMLQKPFPENNSVAHSGGLAGNFETPACLIRDLPLYPGEPEFTPNKLFSVKCVQIEISNLIVAGWRETQFESLSYCLELYGSVKASSNSSLIISVNSTQELAAYENLIILDDSKKLVLWIIAFYVIYYLKNEATIHKRQIIGEKETIDGFFSNEDSSVLLINEPSNYRRQNVIITELDSSDDTEIVKKHKSQRRKINRKKYRKRKPNKQNVESGIVSVPSKLCFDSVSSLTSANEGLTQSKMVLEIEKGLKPIKDQISDLRNTMTNFVCDNNTDFERSSDSGLPVKTMVRCSHKVRSIFTVPSTSSLQKLRQIADISSNAEENFFKLSVSGPRKLSPLAEMYIKLSQKQF
ncbi:uncharacterized protein LOC128987343 [Macrosteles quadrilineatus]|uniref:uncharacterized protein LOC128987343 n=1 Tax=Macrosteles quadrilineatus TaxID=74068 RepID=UPI0023E0CA96|nr:uncharacterized protein LOC128987343 [Macrosteles quadrilineatus]